MTTVGIIKCGAGGGAWLRAQVATYLLTGNDSVEGTSRIITQGGKVMAVLVRCLLNQYPIIKMIKYRLIEVPFKLLQV